MLRKNASILLIFISQVTKGYDPVLLQGTDRPTFVTFKTNEKCGLVYPFGDNYEQESALTNHYRLHSSRLKYNDASSGFNIKYPTYQEALTWNCCRADPKNPTICRTELNRKKVVISFSPVHVTKITQIYHQNDVKELSAVVVEANLPRPSHDHAIQLILDVDPQSCNNKRYTKKFTYQLLSKSRRDRSRQKYFAFSDSSLPKDCDIYLYLQKSCLLHSDDCNTELSGNRNSAYSHSGMIDQFKALNFTTTYSGSHPNQILTGSGRQIDGKSLNVLHPVDDQFPMTNDISFFINGDNISAKLPLVGPNYVTGRISGNKAVCEAKGNPKPTMVLKQSLNEAMPCLTWESCGWNCRRCSWTLPRISVLKGDFTCLASNAISTDEIIIKPSEHIEKIKNLSPQEQTISIYGADIHEQSTIHLNATVVLRNWQDKRDLLVEKKTAPKSRDKSRTKDRVYNFRSDRIDDFKKLIQNQVLFTKHGSEHFACGRKSYNVFFDSKCLTSNYCEATVQMIILFPQKEDEGTYAAEMVYKLPNQNFKGISRTVEIFISTTQTDFVKAINTTQDGRSEYNKFSFDWCKAINGESAKCQWYPMWKQLEHSTIYSIHYFNTEICEDTLTPNKTILQDYMNDNLKPPRPLSIVTHDLTPGVKYQIMVCTWKSGSESRDIIVAGRREVVVTGYGERYCRFYETTNSDGVKIEYLKMPLESPKYYPPQPYIRHGQSFVEFFYKSADYNKFMESSVEGFEIIYRLMSTNPSGQERFVECNNCPILRFISTSIGNGVKISNLAPGTKIRPFFRFVNRMGPGPYDDSMRNSGAQKYHDVDIDSDPSVERNSIHLMNISQHVESGDLSYLDFDIIATVATMNKFAFISHKDEDIFTMHSNDKCSVITDGLRFHCTVPIADNTQRLVLSSENQFPITTMLFNFNDVADSVQEPQLTYVNRTETDVTIRFTPKVLLFDNNQIKVPIYTVYLKYSDHVHPDDSKRNFVQNFTLPSQSELWNGPELEFTYRFKKCEILRQKHVLFKAVSVEGNGRGCLPFADVRIWIVQSYQKDDRVVETLPSISVLIENSEPSYLSSDEVNKYVAEFPIPEVHISAVPYQSQIATADFTFPRKATTNEYEVQVQVVQKPRHIDCDDKEAFMLKQNFGTTMVELDDKHNRFISLTKMWFIPRQRFDPYSYSKSNTYSERLSEIKRFSQIDNPPHIRLLGGLDGYSTHCGSSVSQCMMKIDSSPNLEHDVYYKSNGYLSLPDNPNDEGANKKCLYCYRARLVFKGPTDDSTGNCLGDKIGCYGVWSKGKEFKNPEDKGCDWNAQFPGFEKEVRTTSAPPTDAPQQGLEPSPEPVRNQVGILIGTLLVVVIFVIILGIMGRYAYRRMKYDRSHYYRQAPGSLQNMNINHNMCNMPLHRGICHSNQDQEIPRSVNQTNKTRSYSPHVMPNQTDESVCSIVSRPESSRYSSFDSGIDRNSGSFRSDTPWANN